MAARHIVITGASSGIGAALAVAYAQQGARLTLFGRDEARLQQVEKRCGSAAVRLVVADVTDDTAMATALAAADDGTGIDLVIANAGMGGADTVAGADGEDAAVAARVIRTNVLGVINTVAPLIPRFTARRCGHIAIVGSLAGYVGLPDSPAYSASKAAVHTYGHGLRRMLAGSGVCVSVISPGFVETPMSASLPFRGPFTWSAERAAATIMRGIERRKADIAFPFPVALAMRLVSHMPLRLADVILNRIRGATLPKRKP